MLTYSEKEFNPESPNRRMISVTDIAHGLAMNPRFNGQLEEFFSVAEHCIIVQEILEIFGHSPRMQILGLFHDGEEAYTGDIPSPIKVLLKPYIDEIAEPIKRAIYSKLRVKGPNKEEKKQIKIADNLSFLIEDRDHRKQKVKLAPFLSENNISTAQWESTQHLTAKPVGIKYAKIKFLERYLDLVDKLDIDIT